MCPLELVATPIASPSVSPAGIFRKFGIDVYWISGTFWAVAFAWAKAGAAANSRHNAGARRVIRPPRIAGVYQNDAHARAAHRADIAGLAGRRAPRPARGAPAHGRTGRPQQGDVRRDEGDDRRQAPAAGLDGAAARALGRRHRRRPYPGAQ